MSTSSVASLVELIGGRPVLRQRRLEAPSGQHHLRLRVVLTGICHSDIRELRNTRALRHDFGHEIVGHVMSASPELNELVGERVVFNPNIPVHKTSGFATEVVAWGTPRDLRSAFIPVAPTMTDDLAVLIEPTACAHHCVDALLGLFDAQRPCSAVHIHGTGTFGAIMAVLLAARGVEVQVSNRSPDRLQFWKTRGVLNEQRATRTPDALILATSESSPSLLHKLLQEPNAPSRVVIFGGTPPGGDFMFNGVDLDAVRRNEQVRTCVIGTTHYQLKGTYGANSEDFRSAMKSLATIAALSQIVLDGLLHGPSPSNA